MKTIEDYENLIKRAEELDYSSIVAKLAGEELTDKQKADYEEYRALYEEASNLRSPQ